MSWMDMEHAEALERIEIAAAEPLGFERLMAGDTPDAAAVAGHLAGCPACVAELARLRRTAALAREVIASQPDPALRERTLDLVRAAGRDRSAGARAAPAFPDAAAAATTTSPAPLTTTASTPVAPATAERPAQPTAPVRLRSRVLPRPAWIAALAAASIVVGVVGFAAGGASHDDPIRQRDAEIAVLRTATTTTLRIEAQPDARRVALDATNAGGAAAGSLVFSPTTGELVVVATGLPVEDAGQEYGCWVEVDGTRRRLGRMYWGGDVAAWSGPAVGLSDLPPGTTFGVSLGPSGGSPDAAPVLTGRL
jgi:Anti-sigma-K factor rskA, C-terminal